MDWIEEQKLRKLIQEESLKTVKEYLKSGSFKGRNLTDIPTDDNAMVNRRYVNLNGTVANRPVSSVATVGQKYFSTSTNIPMTFDGSNWRNGVGSVVASGT